MPKQKDYYGPETRDHALDMIEALFEEQKKVKDKTKKLDIELIPVQSNTYHLQVTAFDSVYPLIELFKKDDSQKESRRVRDLINKTIECLGKNFLNIIKKYVPKGRGRSPGNWELTIELWSNTIDDEFRTEFKRRWDKAKKRKGLRPLSSEIDVAPHQLKHFPQPSSQISPNPNHDSVEGIDTPDSYDYTLPKYPEGVEALDSRFYIERPSIESECYHAILQPGALIRIKAPKQMGKTSLLVRILEVAAKQGNCQIVSLNLLEAEQKTLSSLDVFLRWFCFNVGKELKQNNQLTECWVKLLTPNTNCKNYFEEYILPNIKGSLVLALDNTDKIFTYENIAKDFLGMLRAWHGYSNSNNIKWKSLRLIIVHSTDIYINLEKANSPFNVGTPIELSELSSQQVEKLANLHQVTLKQSEISELMDMIGGHPYLVRLAIYYLCRGMNLGKLLSTAPTAEGIYSSHLREMLETLLTGSEEVVAAFKRVVIEQKKVELDPRITHKLYSIGLVTKKHNQVLPLNNLYHQYFSTFFNIQNTKNTNSTHLA